MAEIDAVVMGNAGRINENTKVDNQQALERRQNKDADNEKIDKENSNEQNALPTRGAQAEQEAGGVINTTV